VLEEGRRRQEKDSHDARETRRTTGDPNARVNPSILAGASRPRETTALPAARWITMGKNSSGRDAGWPKPCRANSDCSSRPRKQRKGRVFLSIAFFQPKKSSCTALKLRTSG